MSPLTVITIVVITLSFATGCIGYFAGYVDRVTGLDARWTLMIVTFIVPTSIVLIVIMNTQASIDFRQAFAFLTLPILAAGTGVLLGGVDFK
ncbi:hypothetical protein B1757_13780 [Acidithiobacillus marinus]|uniref:Uncharacterized protein n=1 Tax=Acidithiobacillus marinus TaxID=187490 RepID=A0A2I1DIH9_9PROT|nr:hypothetical protein [Acidithiobacillus marinus]PKY09668.1 hypothetical protein B1757_13780 [Acidithiobacillus marinus]